MATIVEDLKAQARILHRRATAGDAPALARLGKTEEPIKRGDCLSALARELGFDGWPHAVTVLSGRPTDDYGTLLYPPECSAHSNIWCATYDEAHDIRAETGGYLLAYKHQFLIVDRYFIETIGLDPNDADWERIGRDWVQPLEPEARSRLYGRLVRARQTAST